MSTCAVITGAAGALGQAVARELRRTLDVDVALVDSAAHLERAAALATELGRAKAFAADLADDAAWSALLRDIEKSLGAPREAALIAGGYAGGAPFWETDAKSFERMFTGNVTTVAASLRALLPGMVERGVGRIVVVGSRAVERPWTAAQSAAYGASKAAVVALAQAVAAECIDRGVTVNAILPSTLDTPANRAAMPKADPSLWVPLGAAARLVVSLLDPAAGHTSGAAIPIYGRA